MGRTAKYPYHLLTNGEWHDVRPAEYDSSPAKLRAIFHQYARAHGFTLMSITLPDDTLTVRFWRI